jgi:asparagine synthetase B (glutamine-hydrolysing)
MCGIVAIYSPHGRVSPETLARATARLHHRGPDAQRRWLAAGLRIPSTGRFLESRWFHCLEVCA